MLSLKQFKRSPVCQKTTKICPEDHLLCTEMYYASIGKPYSKSYVNDNKDRMFFDTSLYKNGVDDNQKFRSNDGHEVTLPILLLSRYFDFFTPFLSDMWKREEVVDVDICENDLRQIKDFLAGIILDYETCKTAFDYFRATSAYTFVVFPVGYNDTDLMTRVGKILKESYHIENIVERLESTQDAVEDVDNDIEDIDCFVLYQDIICEGKLRNFSAEFYYNLEQELLGLELYMGNCECNEYDKMDSLWVDRAIDTLTPYVEDYIKTGKVKSLLYQFYVPEIDLTLLVTELISRFTGKLDQEDTYMLVRIIMCMDGLSRTDEEYITEFVELIPEIKQGDTVVNKVVPFSKNSYRKSVISCYDITTSNQLLEVLTKIVENYSGNEKYLNNIKHLQLLISGHLH